MITCRIRQAHFLHNNYCLYSKGEKKQANSHFGGEGGVAVWAARHTNRHSLTRTFHRFSYVALLLIRHDVSASQRTADGFYDEAYSHSP